MSRNAKTAPPAFEAPVDFIARQRRLQVMWPAAFAAALLGFDCLDTLLRERENAVPAGMAIGAGQGIASPVPQVFCDDCAIAPDLAPFYGLAMDINRATERELTLLPGIGPVLAARITAARGERGGFTEVRELREVPGIGDKTLAALAPHVCIP